MNGDPRRFSTAAFTSPLRSSSLLRGPALPPLVPDWGGGSSIPTFLVLPPLIAFGIKLVFTSELHIFSSSSCFFFFVFSGSNNFVPFLILCNNYGSAMLQIFPSPRLYFVFFCSALINNSQTENGEFYCNLQLLNESQLLFCVAQTEFLRWKLCSPECNLASSLTGHISRRKGGGGCHVQSNALSSCVAPNRRRSPSGIL